MPVGVEVREPEVSESDYEGMRRFVYEYLSASVANEEDGGRMRWYPWHSADYRYNHIVNVTDLAAHIAEREGADVDVVKVAALFHDVAKLEVDQDVHAEAGARVAREYLESYADLPESFVDRVCEVIERHSYQGPLSDLSVEAQSLIEADVLDKVGANGTALMLLRMGYESRTHMAAADMVQRVLDRGRDAMERVESETAERVADERLERVRRFREWLVEEVPEMTLEGTDGDHPPEAPED